MSVLFLVIPLAFIIVSGAIGAFFWAVSSGQMDDLETPAQRVASDDDEGRFKSAAADPLSHKPS